MNPQHDAPGILTLTTDFGPDGPYVAALKGLLLGRSARLQIVDVSHRVEPQNILEGAFVLASVFDCFPTGTVHLAVIDPGFGMARPPVAALVDGQWVVAPDNGLIGGVLRRRVPDRIIEVAPPAIHLGRGNRAAHSREMLAAAAAHLALGGEPSALGPPRISAPELLYLEAREDGPNLIGEIVYRDAFGNLVTNVAADQLGDVGPSDWSLEIADKKVVGLVSSYAERPGGSLVALVGSSGWVEIAVVNGDAGRVLAVGTGTTVWLRRRKRIDAPIAPAFPVASFN